MNNKIIWIVIVLVLIGGLFWSMSREDVETTDNTQMEVTEEESSNSVVVVLGAQNDSGMSGTATLTELGNTTLVALDLGGVTDAVPQPAHIHAGSCATIGGIVYPLESLVNGTSQTTLNTPLATILAGLPLAINVHKSAAEVSVYLACGDVML